MSLLATHNELALVSKVQNPQTPTSSWNSDNRPRYLGPAVVTEPKKIPNQTLNLADIQKLKNIDQYMVYHIVARSKSSPPLLVQQGKMNQDPINKLPSYAEKNRCNLVLNSPVEIHMASNVAH